MKKCLPLAAMQTSPLQLPTTPTELPGFFIRAGDEGMEGAVLQGVEREEHGGDRSPAGKDRIFG